MSTKVNVEGLKQGVKSNTISLFYAPWCGHCKRLHPTYESFATDVKKQYPMLHVTRIDMQKHGQQVKDERIGEEEFGAPLSTAVKGFPTIMLFRKDGDTRLYSGERTQDGLMQAVRTFYG
jgi:thiol-disulfide isomerase/thioredoxin